MIFNFNFVKLFDWWVDDFLPGKNFIAQKIIFTGEKFIAPGNRRRPRLAHHCQKFQLPPNLELKRFRFGGENLNWSHRRIEIWKRVRLVWIPSENYNLQKPDAFFFLLPESEGYFRTAGRPFHYNSFFSGSHGYKVGGL